MNIIDITEFPSLDIVPQEYERQIKMENAIGDYTSVHLVHILQDKTMSRWPQGSDDTCLIVDLILRDVSKAISNYPYASLVFYQLRRKLVLLRHQQVGLLTPRQVVGDYQALLVTYINNYKSELTPSQASAFYKAAVKFLKSYADSYFYWMEQQLHLAKTADEIENLEKKHE